MSSDSPTRVVNTPHPRLGEAIAAYWASRGESGSVDIEQLSEGDPVLAKQLTQFSASLEDLDGEEGELAPPPAWIEGYRVLRELGSGGTSDVYLCEQASPRRCVALKLLRVPRSEPNVLRRFRLEIELLATLSHPGLADVLDVGEVDLGAGPQPYFTMTYVDGQRLGDSLRRNPSLPRAERLRLFLEVCDAVDHAHRAGVVHRDLKPSNLLVDREGRVKVVDFGLAKMVDGERPGQTRTRFPAGTPPYMSPEQFDADQRLIDARSDVYSLGVVLYEMLTGHMPYEVAGKSFLEVAAIVRNEPPSAARRHDRSLRGDAERVLAKALEKDPGDRYQSVAEFAADVRRLVEGRPVLARHPGPWRRVVSWTRRNPIVAALGATTFAGLVIAFGLALESARSSDRHARELEASVDRWRTEFDRAERQGELAREMAAELRATGDRLAQTAEQYRQSTMNANLMRAGELARTDPAAAHEILLDHDRCPPDLRGFAWRLTEKRTRPIGFRFEAHGGPITGVGMAGAGGVVATATRGGLKLWRVERETATLAYQLTENLGTKPDLILDDSGRLCVVRETNGHVFLLRRGAGATSYEKVHVLGDDAEDATAVAVAHDGRGFAIGFEGGRLQVWPDGFNGPTRSIPLDARVVGLRFGEGDELAAATFAGTITRVDLKTFETSSRSVAEPRVWLARFDDSLERVLLGRRYERLELRDAKTGELLREVPRADARPDGLPLGDSPLKVCVLRHGRVEILDEKVIPRVLVAVHGDPLRIAFDRHGETIVVGHPDGSVAVKSLKGAAKTSTIPADRPGVRNLEYTPDGRLLVWCGPDADLRVRDRTTGEVTRHVGRAGHVVELAVDEGGHAILSYAHRTLGILDLGGCGESDRYVEPPERLAAFGFDADGRLCGAGKKGHVFVLDAEGRPGRRESLGSPGSTLAVSPGGRRLVTGEDAGWVRTWEARNLRPLARRRVAEERITCLGWSPDGRHVAAGSRDGVIRVLDAETLEPVAMLRGHAGVVTSLAFSARDDVLASASVDGRVLLWDTRGWERQTTLECPFTDVRVVRFAPDGEELVAGGGHDEIAVWNVAD